MLLIILYQQQETLEGNIFNFLVSAVLSIEKVCPYFVYNVLDSMQLKYEAVTMSMQLKYEAVTYLYALANKNVEPHS